MSARQRPYVYHDVTALVSWGMQGTPHLREQRIKAYILAYLVYRFFSEEIRPEPEAFLGLTWYQVGCLAFVPLFVALWIHDARHAPAAA